MFAPLLIAIQFLTIIPVRVNYTDYEQQFLRSVLYYPVVGLIIGILISLAAVLLKFPTPLLNAAVILALWVIITGGLHLDGLADCADAWVGGLGNKQRTLEIMKDSRSGAMAIIAVCLLLLIKFAAITTLLQTNHLSCLLIIPIIARLSVLLLYQTSPYINTHGIGAKTASNYPKLKSSLIIISSLVLIFSYLAYFSSLLLAFFTLISFIILVYYLRKIYLRRLAGITGDTLGASIEIIEMCLLLQFSLA